VLAFRDQTRERAAEKELHGLMERQQAILAAVPDIIVEVDRHKIITWANQAGQEFYGDDVIGHEAADYFEGEEDVYEVVRPLFNGSSPAVYVESRQRRKDGQIRLLAWWCRSLTDDRGNVIGALSSAQDITERKRAEEKLRESEERYRSIMEQAADTVIMHDETGRIVDANRQACRSLGYSREELLSKSIGDIDPEAVQAEKQELWGKVLAGEQFTFESLQIRKDGSVIPVEVTLGSVRLPLGPAIIGIVRDITERKQLEKDTAKARADFLYAVSHELKTPLFLMTATVEMMKLQTEEERRFRFMSQEETWIRNLARLRLLINNLVDSQRTATLGTQLTRTPTDLAALVRQAVEDLDVFAVKQSITWQMDLDSLPDLPLDPEAIERTMHNLLTNAIKFSPPGGTVQIRLRAQPDQVALEIEDHGKGIPAAEMSRLFQPFARAGSAVKAVIPGTGLGLYVSKVLVEAHGGAISLRSEEGVGATVTVTLPLRE
jgi:PAS domain S-box-containing protein